jgi:hypothetical protein
MSENDKNSMSQLAQNGMPSGAASPIDEKPNSPGRCYILCDNQECTKFMKKRIVKNLLLGFADL